MKPQPATLARLLTGAEIERRATPANLHYGRAIYRRGGVEFIEGTPRKVVAWVGGLDGSVAEGGSQRRRARLSSTAAGLRWHCTGNPKNHQFFCKHCIALALVFRRNVSSVTERAIAWITGMRTDRSDGLAFLIRDDPVERIVLKFPLGLLLQPSLNGRFGCGRPHEFRMTRALAVEIPADELFRVGRFDAAESDCLALPEVRVPCVPSAA